MKTNIIHTINRIKQFISTNQKWLQLLILLAIVMRFIWLNTINWHSGEISNGLHGIKYMLDSNRYLFGAESMLSSEGLEGRQYQFIGYMLIIAFFKLLSLPDIAIITFQLLLAGFAAYALYRTVIILTQSKLAAIFVLALFLCNPFIVRWHLYIATESIYTSMVILFFWRLVHMIKMPSLKNYFFTAIALIITMFIRPNGWILLPVFVALLINTFSLNKYIKSLLIVVNLVAFVFLMGAVGSFKNSIQITTPVQNLQEGITVWGHPELNLTMPQAHDIECADWVGGVEYIVRYPIASMKLGATRVGYIIIHVRPYHSTAYKLRVLFWILPAYFLCLFSLISLKRKPEIIAAILVIIAHFFVVAVSYAEHDSRFDVYVLPIFYVLAGVGLSNIIDSMMLKLRKINRNSCK